MALIRCGFRSQVLGEDAAMTVVVPDAPARPAVLYLLHGRGDDHTAWTRRTSLERYAEDHGMAVVMPQGGASFFRDEVAGRPYWSFLSDELPTVCDRLFGLGRAREQTFVAGLSMGGYGALHWALRRPDQFAAAASMSGALDVASVDPDLRDEAGRVRWRTVFGAGVDLHGSDADLLHLVRSGPADRWPALYVQCGDEDELLPANDRFVAAARGHGVDVRYEVTPGRHDWTYWELAVQRVLAWLDARTPRTS